jgi:hypothetical protein
MEMAAGREIFRKFEVSVKLSLISLTFHSSLIIIIEISSTVQIT